MYALDNRPVRDGLGIRNGRARKPAPALFAV